MIFYQQSIEYFIQTNPNRDYEEKSVNMIFYNKNGRKAFLHGIFLYAYPQCAVPALCMALYESGRSVPALSRG